jgi:hypothetical protein
MMMTRIEKIKQAVAVAVAYYVEQEKQALTAEKPINSRRSWVNARNAIQMRGRQIVQQRGRIGSTRILMKKETNPILN